MYRQSGATYLPLRINSAGMIPLIFAFSIVILPGTMATYFATNSGWFGDVARFFADLLVPSAPLYWVLVFILVVIFTFFFKLLPLMLPNYISIGFEPGVSYNFLTFYRFSYIQKLSQQVKTDNNFDTNSSGHLRVYPVLPGQNLHPVENRRHVVPRQ